MDHVPDVLTWRRRIWIWGPAAVQMAVIFAFSATPDLKEIPFGFSDFSGHFIGYSLLGALLARATAGARWAGVTPAAAVRAWVLSAAYGVTDEIHQSFVPGRSMSAVDWVADATGAALANVVVVVLALVVRRSRGRAV